MPLHAAHPRGPFLTGSTRPMICDAHAGAAKKKLAGATSSGWAGRLMSLSAPESREVVSSCLGRQVIESGFMR